MGNRLGKMEKLILRSKQFNIVKTIYLCIFFIGVCFSFLASYLIENLNSDQVFKIFLIPIFILFIVTIFLLLIFFMTYSNEKKSNLPKWWFLFYVSMFIPYIRYFVPYVIFILFLGKEISVKNKVILGIMNFLPLILKKIINIVIYKFLLNFISDKVLLMDLNLLLCEIINWVLIGFIISKIVKIEETYKLENA